MKLRVIKKEEFSNIYALDPLSFGSRLCFPGYYCIGAFPEGGDEKVPRGILIYCDSGKELVIHWLYVAPEHRGRGIGEKLLSGIYILAKERSYKQIGAMLCDTPDTRDICPFGESYLLDRYFEKKVPHAGEWHAKLKAITKSRAFREKRIESCPGVTGRMARDLTASKKYEILRGLAADEGVIRMQQREPNLKEADDVSTFCFDDKKLSGAAVFAAGGRDLFLTHFFAVRDELAYFILPAAIMEAFRQHPGAVLHIALRDNDYEELFSELLGPPDPVHMRLAQTEMFFADQDYDVYEEPDFFEALSLGLEKM